MPLFGGSDERGQRTAAEREAARQERERRRAGRAGGGQGLDDATPEGAEQAPDEADASQATPEHAGQEPELADGNGAHPETQAFEVEAELPPFQPATAELQSLHVEPQLPQAESELHVESQPPHVDPQLRDAESLLTDAESQLPDAESQLPDAESQLPDSADVDGLPAERPVGYGGPAQPEAESAESDPAKPAGAEDRPRRTVRLNRSGAGRASTPGDPRTSRQAGQAGRIQKARQAGRSRNARQDSRAERVRRGRQARQASQARGSHRPRTPKTMAARIAAAASLLIVAVLVWLLISLFQPFQGPGHGRVVVTIPKGAGASKIGGILEKAGVVSSGFFFDVRTFLDGKRGDFHAGRFALKQDMSYSSAIAALTGQIPHAAVVKVVIPEGETRRQIAAIARKDGLKGDYLRATKHAGGFDPVHYGAPSSTPNLEGFLFPATYELDVHTNVSTLVTQQLEAFHERFDSEAISRARALHITPYQLLTVASMIEREAKLPKDRPKIAAVIYNRLHLGMPLGIDATIRFALNDYEKPLTESQLHINSPYNTRTHKGLPPTPISNPGMESIEAAAHPAKVGYLYYVNGADGCGDLVFSNSYAEFEEDSAAYQAALEANGGNAPTCKKK